VRAQVERHGGGKLRRRLDRELARHLMRFGRDHHLPLVRVHHAHGFTRDRDLRGGVAHQIAAAHAQQGRHVGGIAGGRLHRQHVIDDRRRGALKRAAQPVHRQAGHPADRLCRSLLLDLA
jgi:hypothetical protein